MPKREPTIDVKFNRRELDLLLNEMKAAIENGAKDPEYPVIRDKAQRACVELIRRLTAAKR